MTYADDCTRVYTTWGLMAHLLGPFDTPNGYSFSLCRRQPRLFGSWLGTGSQDEHDRAAALPTCGKCAASADRADKVIAEAKGARP